MTSASLSIVSVLFCSLTFSSEGRYLRSAGCDVVCPREENPVCARCGDVWRSFSHPCLLRKESQCFDNRCAIQNHGTCEENANDCETDCTKFPFNPFCAKDGNSYKTFSNACQLEKQNRCAKQNFQQVTKEECYQKGHKEV